MGAIPAEDRRFLNEVSRPCPCCGESIPASRLTCPLCKGKIYRKLVESDLPATQGDGMGKNKPAPSSNRKGRPKKEVIDPRLVDFEGLDVAAEHGQLRTWRQSRGLSQSDMATILEITKQHYQRIEGGTGKVSTKIRGRIIRLMAERENVKDPQKSAEAP